MNPKLFYIIKALDNFPVDIKVYIYNLIKVYSANLIYQKMSSLYHKKINDNCFIYLTFYRINKSFSTHDSSNIKKILLYAKHNITYNYIQNYNMWVDEIAEIFYMYGEDYKISNECLELINHILNKFERFN